MEKFTISTADAGQDRNAGEYDCEFFRKFLLALDEITKKDVDEGRKLFSPEGSHRFGR